MNARTYSYRGYKITPKRDFGTEGYLSNGKIIRKGWIAVLNFCNDMPGGTWFKSIREAKDAIDVWLKVKKNATKFWEIMQPFEYKRVGQKADFENGEVRCGRFCAIIQNFRVVKLLKNCKSIL